MYENSTILVVDDTISNLEIISHILDDYDIIQTTNAKNAFEIIDEEDIDLILLDIIMPEITGLDMCKTLKANHKTKDIPIIFLTSQDCENYIEKAFDVGGLDYITKPFKPIELQARVKTQLKHQNLIKELDFLATKDSLTNIFNRRKFFELANDIFQTQKDIHTVMIDIDKFKSINDTYGHQIGDEVLKACTNIINKNLIDNTIFARLGGEEFVVLYYKKSIDEVMTNMQEITKTIENSLLTIDNKDIKFTISSGISSKKENETLDMVLNNADKNLYIAKDSGRNRVIFRIL